MSELSGPEFLVPVLFLSLFELIGGLVMGIAMFKIVRSEFERRTIYSQAFLLLWGVLFAGIPLFAAGRSIGFWAFLILAAVLCIAWAAGFLLLDRLGEWIRRDSK